MTPFMRLRERIRNSIRVHEVWFARIGHGLIMLAGLVAIVQGFPFAQGLDSGWILAALSVLGIFMPMSAIALVWIAFLLLDLFSLSGQMAGVTAGVFLVAYAFCTVYRAKKLHNIAGFIVARQWHVPGIVPLQTALLGTANEIVTVICGAAVSFFLQEIHTNAGVLMEGENQMSTIDFLRERIISNQMFYVYLLAMCALFLITYALRTRNMDHAWMIAVFGGVAAEFLILLSGYLLTGARRNVPMLVMGSLATLAVGAATNYLYRDLDYTRIEKVQFEDDEYYYYVTAVPKIRLSQEKKEVKTINRVSRNRKGRSR